MTSTDTKIGMSLNGRPSSRVLKPPGGGHSNIFAEPEAAVIAPRAKYNQQNSSNLNACMNSTDPNKKVEQLREEVAVPKQQQEATPSSPSGSEKSSRATTNGGGGRPANNNNNNNDRGGRVPPGGFSSGGFW